MVKSLNDLREGDVISNVIYNRMIRSNKNILIGVVGSTGCQPAGNNVLMANGEWKDIKNIKIGDEVISPQKDGTNKFVKVVDTTSWICDKTYDIVEKNKQHKKLYSCSNKHILPVFHEFKKRITKNKKRKVVDRWQGFREYEVERFSKMSCEMKSHQNIGFSSFPIKKFKGVVNCEIEPYALGTFLGDGMSNIRTSITSEDKEIINEIDKYYKFQAIYKKKGTKAKEFVFGQYSLFVKLLKKYGLDKKGSGKKFIPREALTSDVNYRKRLLAGIIDTDGYYKRGGGGYEITLKSKRLIEDIRNLVYSLGGRCGKLRKVTKRIVKINFIGKYYKLSFYLGKIKLPLKLDRKKRDVPTVYLNPNRIAIDTVRGSRQRVYGFTLSDESKSSWYITNNWMVTHNSGKSYVCLRIAELWYQKYFHEPLPVENICFSIEDMMKRITSKKCRRGELLILEEAGVNVGSMDFQTKIVKSFNYVLQSFRSKNIGIICNLPHFGMLSKQTRQLLHMLLQTQGIDKSKKLSHIKPFNLQVNQQTGKVYRHYPQIIVGKYYEKVEKLTYSIPSEPLRQEYEHRKGVFVDDLAQEVLNVARLGNKKPLTEFQKRLWAVREQGVIKQVEQARILGCKPQNVSQNWGFMERKGWIFKDKPKNDVNQVRKLA